MTALRRIPVRIAGAFQPVAYVGRAEWHGIATADEPITALVLARSPEGTHWSRGLRRHANELAIRLIVQPDEADESRYAVRIVCAIGGGALHLRYRLTSTAPFMFTMNHVETGVVSWFAHVWTAEENTLGALFVAETDTRSARKHLWHARKGIDGPSVPLTAALGYGRSGKLAEG
jgi:hypothetical protein